MKDKLLKRNDIKSTFMCCATCKMNYKPLNKANRCASNDIIITDFNHFCGFWSVKQS